MPRDHATHDLLDAAILRLEHCSRTELLTVHKMMDGIEATRRAREPSGIAHIEPDDDGWDAWFAQHGVGDPSDPGEFAIDQHRTRIDGTSSTPALREIPRAPDDDPYEVEYDFEGGAA